jgi:hypothetical protein
MPNKGARTGDSKKKKEVKTISFFHNPNDSIVPDPVQQFDILTGVEKDKKVKPKDVFEDYHNNPDKRKTKKEDKKHRNAPMNPAQVRGKKRGLDKKQEKGKKK